MESPYERNFPSLSELEQKILNNSRIFIAGSGGLGGYLLEFMIRLGVGSVTICDGDSFSVSNLNRQLLSSRKNLGTKKVFAAEKRALEINPELKINAIPRFINNENAVELIKGCDIVLDGLDNPESRKLLYAACEKAGIPYVYGAVSGYIAQAAILLPGSGVLESIYPEGVEFEAPGILSFTPALAASMQSALCLKYLCKKPFRSNILYCADLFNMDFQNFLMY